RAKPKVDSRAPRTKLFDSDILGSGEQALDFISNILESSTEYSIIGKDLDGRILLWNEGARRLYGYEPDEVVGRANSIILHTPEDVATGKPREIMDAALRDGKWEGTLNRLRKNGQRFTARVVITPMVDLTGQPREVLIGSRFKNYFTDPRCAEQGIERVLREGRVTNYELTVRSKDGRETVVSYNASVLKSAGGKLQGVFAAAR